jgi:hypothetical protein
MLVCSLVEKPNRVDYRSPINTAHNRETRALNMTEMSQFRWGLKMTGPKVDLEAAIILYEANSDLSVTSIDDGDAKPSALLTSPQLEAFDKPTDVENAAKRLLGVVNGVLFVLEPARTPLAFGGVRERNANGNWTYHISPPLVISRSRVMGIGVAIVDGKLSPSATLPPPASRWTAAAQADPAVGDVFRFLSGQPDWFNFYKAFELMRDDINARMGKQHRQEQIGWPTKKILDHFTLSAQVYRHAPPWDGGYTPEKAMTLVEATKLIQSLTNKWLVWRFNPVD